MTSNLELQEADDAIDRHRARIAELEAEVERLKAEVFQNTTTIVGLETKLALSRTGAVKGEPAAFLVERLAGSGYGSPRKIIDAAKYDPRRDEFWVGDAKSQHLVTPLYALEPVAPEEALKLLQPLHAQMAPEGRHEAVEALRKLLTYGERTEMAAERKGTLFRFDDGSRFFLSDIDTVSLARPPEQAVTATHRHKKRGTEYVLIGIGKMQTENWESVEFSESLQCNVGLSVDMEEVAIYRSVVDGSLWVRPREEFEDGRFEALKAAMEAGRHD